MVPGEGVKSAEISRLILLDQSIVPPRNSTSIITATIPIAFTISTSYCKRMNTTNSIEPIMCAPNIIWPKPDTPKTINNTPVIKANENDKMTGCFPEDRRSEFL